MRDISNKQRILKVKEIFERETDENNELSIEGLIQRLKLEYGSDYEVGKKAIKDDVKTLSENDCYLIENTNKFGKLLYSKQDRKFEIHELRMLIDAIHSARFITQNESEKLIEKIKSLTSEGLAKKLINQIYVDDRTVCEDKGLKFTIDKLHTAVWERKIILFKYGRYNVYKEFVESNDGDYYEVKPYGVVWHNGFYYLVGFNIEKQKIINYRVDRMRNVDIQERTFIKDYFNLAEHVNRCFNMYPGEVRFIKVKFHKHLINAIIDRFGKDADIEVVDDDHFILSTDAAINTGLVRWILNWGSDAKVIYPEMLQEKIIEEIEKMKSIYNED